MKVVIDVGNSTIAYTKVVDKELIAPKRIETSKIDSADSFKELIDELNLDDLEKTHFIFSCGVSRIKNIVNEYFKDLSNKPIFVSGLNSFGAKIIYETPETLGPDRVANTISINGFFDTPCCVIDCGTAINIDVIDEDGKFIGGSISPGLQTSIDALTTFAPSLPKVEIKAADNIVGKNTVECIQIGVVNLAAKSVDAVIDDLKIKYPKINSVITGGHAHIIHPLLKNVVVLDEWLTLRGLALINAD